MPELTLGRVRRAVQLVSLVALVYGGTLLGHYMADKITGAFPALTCAYDQRTASFCALIPLQHILHHRIGMTVLQTGVFTLRMLLPLAMSLLTFFAFFFVLGKASCGWLCPLGTIQELVQPIGRAFRVPRSRLGPGTVGRVRAVKWLLLGGLVLALPLLTGLGVTPGAFGNPYCEVCPSRILTTLLSGSTDQLGISTADAWRFGLGATANALSGFVLVAALAIRQPFCRICPMLALHGVFKRGSPMRLVKRRSERCGSCGICALSCPMDIHEVWKEDGPRAFHEDCTLCGRCAEFCPDDDVLQLKWGPLPLFRSRGAYSRGRLREERPEGGRRPKAEVPRGA